MSLDPPVIVDAVSNIVRPFPNVTKITIGRSINSSIDIPDPNVSRQQCVILLNEQQKWFIKDMSSHRTTQLNNKRILDETPVLENGDKITFPYPHVELFFYNSCDHVPSIFKKRKSPETPHKLSTPSKKVCSTIKSQDVESEKGLGAANTEVTSSISLADLQILSDELEKYKESYHTSHQELTGLRKQTSVTIDKLKDVTGIMETMKTDLDILKKENEILKDKLIREEQANEKMILEIQELNECLKESEQEQIRLNKESHQFNEETVKEPDEDISISKSEEKEKEDDYFSALALQKIVDLVEVKWHENEIDQLKAELKKKDDQITDLTLETEKRKQEFMEIVDRELLCSICSEVLCDAITLNCRHTFCKACVVEWKNKKRECPVCRSKIKSEVHPLVIDSFVDRLFDVVGGELKCRREEVKSERSKSAMNAPSTSKGNGGTPRRGSHNNRNHRRSRANVYPIQAMNMLHPRLVIDLRDISSANGGPGVIDLTRSPQTRRGRSRSSNYYNL